MQRDLPVRLPQTRARPTPRFSIFGYVELPAIRCADCAAVEGIDTTRKAVLLCILDAVGQRAEHVLGYSDRSFCRDDLPLPVMGSGCRGRPSDGLELPDTSRHRLLGRYFMIM